MSSNESARLLDVTSTSNSLHVPKTYLAFNQNITTNNRKDCLTVQNNKKLAIKPCNYQSNNTNQKFNYVYDNSKLYFTTQNDQCFFVDNDNYIKVKPCDQDKMFWAWNDNQSILDYISGSCFRTNVNNDIIIGKCTNTPKFDINFTDVGTKLCENNNIGGCGKYKTVDNSVFSDVFGMTPTTDQKYKPFVTIVGTLFSGATSRRISLTSKRRK